MVARNYATKFGEIDIIAKKANKLIFIEVKTMRFGTSMAPEENLTWKKLKRMQKAIQMYLFSHKIPEDQQWQMDAISLLIDSSDKEKELKHIGNINIY